MGRGKCPILRQLLWFINPLTVNLQSAFLSPGLHNGHAQKENSSLSSGSWPYTQVEHLYFKTPKRFNPWNFVTPHTQDSTLKLCFIENTIQNYLQVTLIRCAWNTNQFHVYIWIPSPRYFITCMQTLPKTQTSKRLPYPGTLGRGSWVWSCVA